MTPMLPAPPLLPGLVLNVPRRFGDDRGEFREVWNATRVVETGLPPTFVQVNHSRSIRNTLRGLHFQRRHPQGKLVSVIAGAILDVAVDLRAGSETFGRHVSMELSAANGRQLYLPPGFAHGFWALSDLAEVIYLATDFYRPEDEGAVCWDDPTLGIAWPADAAPLLSPKDAAAPRLASLQAADLPFA